MAFNRPNWSRQPTKIQLAVRRVGIEIVVGTNGRVTETRIVESLDSKYGLDREALSTAKARRFKPGTLEGRAVPVILKFEANFIRGG